MAKVLPDDATLYFEEGTPVTIIAKMMGVLPYRHRICIHPDTHIDLCTIAINSLPPHATFHLHPGTNLELATEMVQALPRYRTVHIDSSTKHEKAVALAQAFPENRAVYLDGDTSKRTAITIAKTLPHNTTLILSENMPEAIAISVAEALKDKQVTEIRAFVSQVVTNATKLCFQSSSPELFTELTQKFLEASRFSLIVASKAVITHSLDTDPRLFRVNNKRKVREIISPDAGEANNSADEDKTNRATRQRTEDRDSANQFNR